MPKKIFISVCAAAAGLAVAITALAGGTVDPKKDLEAFQGYFKARFPKVPLEEYQNGAFALPGAEDNRKQWEAIMEFPPYELELDKGKQFWEANNMASCFKNGGKDIAQNYPYWDKAKGEVRTVELDINACLVKLGKAPIKNLQKGTMAEVAAYFKSLSRGQRVSLDLSDPGMVKEYAYGRQEWWAKRGQLNFSCANCHYDAAGKHIGGNILSAGLGHGVGFPAYRAKWGALGTIHRRYGGCNKQVRAAPQKPQSREYRALEVYETYMSTGVPLSAPSQRG